MRRKIRGIVAVLAVAAVCASCAGISGREFGYHMEGRVNALQGGLRNITKFVDRHFFNYTWDDPYAHSDVYAGR